MIESRDATQEDIDYVLDNLWHRGKREGRRIGFSDVEDIRQHIRENPPTYFYTLHADGLPLVIMGAADHDGTCYTYFFATNNFSAYGLALTRFVNRFTKEQFAKLGLKRLELWSAADHPMAEKWFNTLRFFRYGAEGPFTKYVFGAENVVDYQV